MALVSSPSLSWTPSIFPSSFTTRRPSIYWAMKDGNGTDQRTANNSYRVDISEESAIDRYNE
ncbi:unnamed protein product [Wuchereria bancrofti]|uniref:Uncharacterized protein n=1 Tax=Wuchereria bancrofti TaxID=6293 RepID=A0A3P7F044_WUCBA|nr:unnamed protein product [Wuchereria bancrofti]